MRMLFESDTKSTPFNDMANGPVIKILPKNPYTSVNDPLLCTIVVTTSEDNDTFLNIPHDLSEINMDVESIVSR